MMSSLTIKGDTIKWHHFLVEIVPDGRDGYVERPRTLVLIGMAP